MIIKEKESPAGQDERTKAGHQQEKDVAFYLRREFGDDESILVINDLRVEHKGEHAQIDHLVVHPFGLVIIESKSIHGEVKVNRQGEWSRSFRGQWYGMPSPVRQAELQEELVKDLLRQNVEKFLGKLLGIQTQIGGRDWKTICAVSSSAILHRDDMPRAIADQVVKSEFVAKKIRELVGTWAESWVKAKPRFSQQEIEGIGRFLVENHQSHAAEPSATFTSQQRDQIQPTSKPNEAVSASVQPNKADAATLACKKCGETADLAGQYGKYGYYVRCGSCGTNTSMKMPCPACQSRKVRVKKSGPTYTSNCQDCANSWVVFQQAG
ncbi:NERD domain-containing protein [Guyparkeria hydrothermalis]|uniref:nuclease-related domain-containing protein n=1 Tax=Guyparkeria hydrothermalis TaxID=923 RepID=UPI00202026FC|nr:NERD domain-containing protein [Guyparkeria hydrothermalis]MCL7744174.1 NERD domain-containing protein [Guyparkeria hydrothermalis]